ncbi:zinc finger protein 821 isoform 2-T2 [Aplochiton taeniatus]
MSRRKQTNPFKVNWPFHPVGTAGPQHTINMEGRDEFLEESHSNNSLLDEQDSISDSDSDHGDDSSSNTSGDDNHMSAGKRPHCRLQGGGVKQESEEGSGLGSSSFVCPLCTLEFSSPEQLIAHVYQHSSMLGSSKSYVCPVCGRALSSPGSLGRHLLIHSEDRLSNCAVCGSRFTDTNNFNREKLREVLHSNGSSEQTCSMSHPLSNHPMANPGPGSCHGPRSAQGSGPGPCHGPGARSCLGPGPGAGPCQGQGPGPCSGPSPGSSCSGPGPTLPSLPDSLLSGGSSLPDSLDPASAGLPPLPDILNPMPVYPAGVLLVCNSCVAYQQLVESQSPLQKWGVRRKNEPLEARIHRLERERSAKKSKRACESLEEREMRRLRDREAKRMQRLQETDDQRARRLQRDRDAMRMKRASETPEKRQARLIREREAKRLKRRLEKIDPSLRTQIEHDPAAMAALTADMSLFQFPCPMPVPSLDNGLFMKLP